VARPRVLGLPALGLLVLRLLAPAP
jgi:hypothetical protein